MRLQVKFFSSLREATGIREAYYEFAGSTVGELWAELSGRYPGLALWAEVRAVAVNHELSDTNQILRDGDEVAFFPPVSGG